MEVNILGLMATALFILIPTAFLLILYVKTESQNQQERFAFRLSSEAPQGVKQPTLAFIPIIKFNHQIQEFIFIFLNRKLKFQTFSFLQIFRGRRDSNPQLPP
eukprot:TRINITY_DN38231_c1_g3_i4.p3 TRINITY_DN38231_c1_g3~~TRINITY_DN38231_c1_g3_i4.p3  ORF type:complete len:103 (-),score=0.54 TRINITY_DN38231_c1_g3_i4:92-400(-)